MQIRYPKDSNYKKGDVDPNVFYTKKLKETEALKRGILKKDNILEKMRSEMWFPNIDLSTGIRKKVEYVDNIRVIKYFSKNETKDVMIHFHGGGFYGGSTDTVENFCKYVSYILNIDVISVDYSLAPEYPFPIAINEGYEVLKHYKLEYEKIYISGDSAGGSIATSVVIKDIEEKTKYVNSLIIYYPVLLISLQDNVMPDFKWEISKYDIDENSENKGFMNSESIGLKYAMNFIKSHYIKTEERKDNYYVSQIATPDKILKEFPKTLIFTVEYDYLRLEAEYFYERLKKNGVLTECIRYAGQTHAMIDKIGHCQQVEDSVLAIKEFLND